MGNRLLLADDSITIQKVVAIIFANEEFELTVVDNGTAALQKARDCGADASISKPFESQQLIDRVKELLELGKTRAAAPAPAPAARPVPVESAAEELWGDLS